MNKEQYSITNLPKTQKIIEDGMDERLHIGAQGYISIQGIIVADFALGHATLGKDDLASSICLEGRVQAPPSIRLTHRTLMPWMSAGKPVVAVAIAQLWERGLVDIEEYISKYIPGFARYGKGDITVKHLLTHTSGLQPINPKCEADNWHRIMSHVMESPLYEDWEPGKQAGYDPSSGWCVLGEIIKQVDGRDYTEYVRSEIFEPLGMEDSWLSIPGDKVKEYGDRLAILHDSKGALVTEPHSDPLLYSVPLPGGAGRGPIGELGKFYEMLLMGGEFAGQRVLRPETVGSLVYRHRVGMLDRTFGAVYDWGLGFLLAGRTPESKNLAYQYGKYSSNEVFGHGGYQSSIGFADPEHNLVVAWVMNGTPGETVHSRRNYSINSAIYEDLGII